MERTIICEYGWVEFVLMDDTVHGYGGICGQGHEGVHELGFEAGQWHGCKIMFQSFCNWIQQPDIKSCPHGVLVQPVL